MLSIKAVREKLMKLCDGKVSSVDMLCELFEQHCHLSPGSSIGAFESMNDQIFSPSLFGNFSNAWPLTQPFSLISLLMVSSMMF